MTFLAKKQLLLGVSGGIAAYKSADLVRQLRAAGARVRVVMTPAAREFVGERTFHALSGEPVWCDWQDDRTAMEHIDLARWADRILIAPATADTLAKLVQGRADDLLSAICLASDQPPTVAPAMNQAMWRNPATRDNIEVLRSRGVAVWGPVEGEQACGETGPGRMLEPAELVTRLSESFSTGRLAGIRVVVTAGPTREAIDPVRYLSNRSSGKMGYAVAEAAREAGASVVLISGPTTLDAPAGMDMVRVESAAEMLDAVQAQLASACDLFISTAAVADYRPATPAIHKIKRQMEALSLPLQPVTDILASVAQGNPRPFCVGFAAETENLLVSAQKKRISKGVELIAANQVGGGLGFDADDNELLLVWEGGSKTLERASKIRLARQLVEQIAELYAGGGTTQEHHAEHSA
ncbi:phosphopantothenate-cysteine ligase /phosphopantothenoylcysteine decarboxylase [Thiogranum longum]|uniref:Coenzyme A biosynthesis bifunctional protein CoaBC n=1 Tax=Thiogranum longum TaxID=1537524 RepID=A0A4V2PGJ3_9GAMM|nr:bifunctional phosphopantothenoylcysteine decarboxylase/phosphopantothenate--cysteine ligase CoaBC [Thiogranum longum]TCK17116.1 phosphopantothenate-cysteine ligase /phosphopantothenoylcysteine decarboxylase [Thiogranum longum]